MNKRSDRNTALKGIKTISCMTSKAENKVKVSVERKFRKMKFVNSVFVTSNIKSHEMKTIPQKTVPLINCC